MSDQIAKELRRWHALKGHDVFRQAAEALEFRLEALTAEALDAERYRFLRNVAMTLDDVPSVVSGASGEFDFLEGIAVDEAVDEAIAEWKAVPTA